MGGSVSKHEWLKNKIYEQPDIVGINIDVISKTKEQCLMYKGHALTIPDIVLRGDKDYFIEVKSGHNQSLYSKGMSQLEKIVFWHEKNGLTLPDTRLVMPMKNNYKLYIDMLYDLEIYNLGDTFNP